MDIQYKLSSWRVLVGVALLFSAGVVWAGEKQEVTTLVGRGEDFTIIERNGESRSFNTGGLVLKNRATIEVLDRATPEEIDEWAERKGTQDARRALEEQRRKSEIQKKKKAAPVMSPSKKKAIEDLRRYQKWGTLYFYTMKNRPVSNEELTKRLDSGNIEDLKIVDGQRHEYPVVRPSPKKIASDADAPPPGPRRRRR